jgi:hypothetical protein
MIDVSIISAILVPTGGTTHSVRIADEAHPEHEPEIEHSSFQNRHDRLLSLSTPPIVATLPRARGLPLDMGRIHPECPDSDPSDRSVAADVVLRQEPDEEDEEEDEGDRKEDNDDDDNDDDSYSE